MMQITMALVLFLQSHKYQNIFINGNYCSCLLCKSLGDKNLFSLDFFSPCMGITLIKLCAWTKRQFLGDLEGGGGMSRMYVGWILLVLKFLEKSFCCWVRQINKTNSHHLHKMGGCWALLKINLFAYSDFLTFPCVRTTKDHPTLLFYQNLNK